MIGDLLSTAARAQKLDIASIQRGIQDGVIPSYIGIPLLQQKMQERTEAAQMLAGKQAQNQPPIAQQVMSQAQQMTQPQAAPAIQQPQMQQPVEPGGIDQAQSNLPQTGFAGGGIVAFEDGGDVMQSMFDDEDPEDQDYVNAMMASMPEADEGEDEMMAYAPESMSAPTYNEMSYSRDSSAVKQPGQPEHGVAHEEISAKGKRGLEELLDLIKHKESRGRDYDAKGNPLTSPVGAKYAMQVMPATARDPGFGIKPAQSDSPDEYNRVGRELYSKLLNKYNDPKLAAIAYNMGPGKTDKWLSSGADMATLPQESRQYAQGFKEGGVAHFDGGGVQDDWQGNYYAQPLTAEEMSQTDPYGGLKKFAAWAGRNTEIDPSTGQVVVKNATTNSGIKTLPASSTIPQLPVTQSNLTGRSYSRSMGPGFNESKTIRPAPDMTPDDRDIGGGWSPLNDTPAPEEIQQQTSQQQEKNDQSGGLAALFNQQMADNKKERDINKYLALMSAGFGMMGGSSPYAFQNIGRGAQQGISTFAGLNQSVDASDKAILAAQVQNAIAQQKYGQLDKYHQQALEAQKERYKAQDQLRRDLAAGKSEEVALANADKAKARWTGIANHVETTINNKYAPLIASLDKNQLLEDSVKEERKQKLIDQREKEKNLHPTYRQAVINGIGYDPGKAYESGADSKNQNIKFDYLK